MNSKNKFKVLFSIFVTVVMSLGGGTFLFAQQIETIHEDYSYASPNALEGFTSLTQGNSIWMSKKAIGQLYMRDESISAFNFPKSSANKDIVYFSTEKHSGGMLSSNRIYSYNVKTGKLKLLYKENKKERLLRTIGMEGNKLIVLLDGIDNSPGPCYQIWGVGSFPGHGYFDVTQPKNGIQSYTVPQYKKNEAKVESEKCAAELFDQ